MAAPHGFTAQVHHTDARVGGGYRMSFTNFSTGKSHSFDARYLGRQESPTLLERLVKPEVPHGA